ncbi:MAG TPA: peptidoglycan recognition family protein [Verrucomicrobiae bacterium]|jgi:N-acetyl-anhydromuramyl-L-alanine amidase AmpD|nr:peptidoglycan recognition family protein [Verrucomicrobiae bacterium]
MPTNFRPSRRNAAFLLLAFSFVFLPGCLCHQPGAHERRHGDEIVVAGQFFHTGTRVVLWMDPGGYDAYRVERRFAPFDESDFEDSLPFLSSPRTPNRYDIRRNNLTPEELERVRGGGWDLPTLQSNVDQFVIHFDVAGVSRGCFDTLQDHRDLSVHFMCDLDGTIYQTLDLKERARHATISNNRSVGIEIANMGSYGETEKDPLAQWYKKKPDGHTVITIPARYGPAPERTPHFVGRPARREMIVGEVQGHQLHQYDFTPQQYKALARLTAALCTVFPKITCDYPREADGKLMTHKIPSEELRNYRGVLGHYHIQTNKVDPGPAFQWDYVIGEARRLMKHKPQLTVNGQPVLNRPKLIIDN